MRAPQFVKRLFCSHESLKHPFGKAGLISQLFFRPPKEVKGACSRGWWSLGKTKVIVEDDADLGAETPGMSGSVVVDVGKEDEEVAPGDDAGPLQHVAGATQLREQLPSDKGVASRLPAKQIVAVWEWLKAECQAMLKVLDARLVRQHDTTPPVVVETKETWTKVTDEFEALPCFVRVVLVEALVSEALHQVVSIGGPFLSLAAIVAGLSFMIRRLWRK
jgi:hypothetical protein